MKKALLAALHFLVMAVSMLGGCSGTAPASSQTTENGRRHGEPGQWRGIRQSALRPAKNRCGFRWLHGSCIGKRGSMGRECEMEIWRP